MITLSSDQANDAADALRVWFISQEIGPPDALIVMASMIASTIDEIVLNKREEKQLRAWIIKAIVNMKFEPR